MSSVLQRCANGCTVYVISRCYLLLLVPDTRFYDQMPIRYIRFPVTVKSKQKGLDRTWQVNVHCAQLSPRQVAQLTLLTSHQVGPPCKLELVIWALAVVTLDDIISLTLLRTRVKRSAIPLKLKIEDFEFFTCVVRLSTVYV
jgi:hypothetical protein